MSKKKPKYRPNIPFYEFCDKPYSEYERKVHGIEQGEYKPFPEPELADIMVIQVLSVDKDKKAKFLREVEKAAIRMQMTVGKKVLVN